MDDISNACAEAVANNIKGTVAIPHSYGRLQFGADLELFFSNDHWHRKKSKRCSGSCDWN